MKRTFFFAVLLALGLAAQRPAAAAISFSCPVLAPGTQNVPYPSATFKAINATATPVWSATGLPPDLVLSPDGVLSGIPRQTGANLTFSVTVRDIMSYPYNSEISRATNTCSITINPPTPTVTPVTLSCPAPNATVGVAYSSYATASGGRPPYSFPTPISGLPPGISSGSDGLFFGTPTTRGIYPFNVRVIDANSDGVPVTRQCTITVDAPFLILYCRISDGQVNQPYEGSVVALSGVPPYTYTQAPGTFLPQGLSFGPDGRLTGNPNASGPITLNALVSDSSNRPPQPITCNAQINNSPAPVISSLDPTTVTACSANANLTAYGSNFVRVAGSSSFIRFGSFDVTSTATIAAVSANIPGSQLLTAQTVAVKVVNPATNLESNPINFPIRPRPRFTATPRPASVAATSVRPGDFLSIVLDGENFVSDTVVRWNGRNLSISALSSNRIVVAVPDTFVAAQGNATLTVTNVERGNTTGAVSDPTCLSSQTFNITPAPPPPPMAPTITKVTPDTVTAGGPSFTLNLTGTNLQGATIQFGSTSLPASLTVPASAISQCLTSNLTVSVTATLNGQTSQPVPVTVRPAPRFDPTTPVSPSSVTANATGVNLTIRGVNFVSGVTRVRWTRGATQTDLTPTNVSATQMTLAVPNNLLTTATTATNGIVLSLFQAEEANPNLSVSTCSNTTPFAINAAPPPIPNIQLSGLPANATPTDGPKVAVSVNPAYATALSGTLTLSFQPDASVADLPASYDNPTAVFGNARKTLDFTVAANATSAVLDANAVVVPGTVAGKVTVTLTRLVNAAGQSVLPTDSRTTVTTIPRSAPVIQPGSVRIVADPAGFAVELLGMATGRTLTAATFTFTTNAAKVDSTLQFTQPLTTFSRDYYQKADGLSNGSAFKLRVPFALQNGTLDSITNVTVTLSGAPNETSQPASAK